MSTRPPPSLDELAVRYGTDKGSSHPRLTPKRYAEVYEELLEGLVVRKILELGIAAGASIRMWAERFPDATIVGVDRKLPVVQFPEYYPRVKLYRGLQADPELTQQIIEEHGVFELIVDDGSHRRSDQLASLDLLTNAVRRGGWYVVEDLHAPASVGFLQDIACLDQIARGSSSPWDRALFAPRMVAFRRSLTA